MDKDQAQELWDKYFDGKASAEEKILFERLYNRLLKKRLESGNSPDYAYIKAALDKSLAHPAIINKRKRLIPYLSTAAAILIAAFIALYYFNFSKPTSTDIAPGGNKATLTLADGTKINLDGSKTGIQINDEDIHYNDGTKIEAKSIVNRKSEIVNSTMLTLSTPKGGQYQIILSDGSKVWLNAATEIRYPSHFSKYREVSIRGEAYLEIAQKPKQPFRVHLGNQVVEVIGTSFVVSNYPDEPATKTTLVTGAVQVSNHTGSSGFTRLLPGQQALSQHGDILLKTVDVQAELAWKNGEFIFKNESLESILRKVTRWYNVEVEYKDGVDKSETYSGNFSRFKQVSSVLRKLELAGGTHFSIEGRRITASK